MHISIMPATDLEEYGLFDVNDISPGFFVRTPNIAARKHEWKETSNHGIGFPKAMRFGIFQIKLAETMITRKPEKAQVTVIFNNIVGFEGECSIVENDVVIVNKIVGFEYAQNQMLEIKVSCGEQEKADIAFHVKGNDPSHSCLLATVPMKDRNIREADPSAVPTVPSITVVSFRVETNWDAQKTSTSYEIPPDQIKLLMSDSSKLLMSLKGVRTSIGETVGEPAVTIFYEEKEESEEEAAPEEEEVKSEPPKSEPQEEVAEEVVESEKAESEEPELIAQEEETVSSEVAPSEEVSELPTLESSVISSEATEAAEPMRPFYDEATQLPPEVLAMYDRDFEGDYNHPMIDYGTSYYCIADCWATVQTLDSYYAYKPERMQACRGLVCENLIDEHEVETESIEPGYLPEEGSEGGTPQMSSGGKPSVEGTATPQSVGSTPQAVSA